MQIPIVIVNYKSGQTLVSSLRSLFANTSSKLVKVYLVNNGGEDIQAISKIKKLWPYVDVIHSKENLGFGVGNNLALEKILKKNYDLVCLSNPDLIYTPNWLNNLVSAINSGKKIAAASPLILYNDKFNSMQIRATGRDLYIGTEDYRNLANLIGKYKVEHKELTINNEQFIKIPSGRFNFIFQSNLKKLKLKIYNESLDPYRIRFGNYNLVESRFSFLKKIIFKITKNTELKIKTFEVDVPELIIHKKNIEIINSCGSFIREGNVLPDNNYYGQYRGSAPAKLHEAELFHGACVLLKTKALKQTGLFDPEYFLYYEESDLGMRMREKGYKFVVQPKSVVYHKERGARSEKTIHYMLESQKIFIRKWAKKIRAS